MKAIIMAGGFGARMLPITYEIPKSMVPVMNIPLLEHIIMLLKKHNIREIGITLMHLSEKIINYFGDGSKWGVSITYFTEKKPLGTAGSIINASSFYKDTFVVISGDCITDMNILDAVEFHKSKKALATVVLTKVENPVNFGIAITDNQYYIRKFLEKPHPSKIFSNLVNTGVYVLEPDVFNYTKPAFPLDFSTDLFPILIKKGLPFLGYETFKYWSDIGSFDSYINTHWDILNQKVRICIKNSLCTENIFVGKSTVIEPTAVIKGPCAIGDNCYIGHGAVVESYSVIGDNCMVEDKALIKKSILFDNSTIGCKSKLIGTILGKGVRLLHNVSSYENAVIGDNSIVYEHCVIKPNIKIWPGKIIYSMSVVDKNIA